jgi:hypothetical protein
MLLHEGFFEEILILKLPPYTLAGFDLTTQTLQTETIPLDHAANAHEDFIQLWKSKKNTEKTANTPTNN